MIGKFWEALFTYADKAKAEGNKEKLEIVHEIEEILQMTYDLGMSSSSVITDFKGRNDLERLVVSIPDVLVYYDKTDGSIWYELDYEVTTEHGGKRRFDSPQEVIKYLIDFRARKIANSMGAERKAAIEYMIDRLKSIKPNDIYNNPKGIVEKRRK